MLSKEEMVDKVVAAIEDIDETINRDEVDRRVAKAELWLSALAQAYPPVVQHQHIIPQQTWISQG